VRTVFTKGIESCLTPISASDVREGLESKSGLSKYLRAQEFKRIAKDALQFVKVPLALHRTGNNVSHDLMISRPYPTEPRVKCSGRGQWA